MISANVTYLLLFPAHTRHLSGVPTSATKPKDAPYFYNLDIDVRSIENWTLSIDSLEVQISIRLLDEQVITAECSYHLPGGFSDASFPEKEKINKELRSTILEKYSCQQNLVEEYTLLIFPQLKELPSDFITKNKRLLARSIRSTQKPLDETEIKNTLMSQIHYSESDLSIIDWEGAILCSSESEFSEDIQLFMIGNYQLLRYRMLDDSIEKALQDIRTALRHRRPRFFSGANSVLENVVHSQLSLLLDFEKTNQSLLLIGDWYSAQMYRVIVEEFYIDDWKEVVSKKLQSLSSIDETVRQNLTLSWSRLLDFIQIAGWMIILTGSFILFVRDMMGHK